MGGCMSTDSGVYVVTEEEKMRHREVETRIKETKSQIESQVKVLLLGTGESGKSTVLKQMRLIHNMPFSRQEIENYRQSIFTNLIQGMRYLLEAMEDMDLRVSEENEQHVELVFRNHDLRDNEAYPIVYYEALHSLWRDDRVQEMRRKGNAAASPDNLTYLFSSLGRLFNPTYKPISQDILNCRVRTTGITETLFHLRDNALAMIDVGGQKSERRKWIHCFEDVTSILFLASLSGYDQCIAEDKKANQMHDAMMVWDTIYHSPWFRKTSIILFLNKNDIFEEKIRTSDIKTYFPEYQGAPGDAAAGRAYFKKRFAHIALKTGQKRRELYTHFTTATDTVMLKAVMLAVEASY